MKRLFNLFIATLCVVGTVSCGGPSKRDVTVSNVEIMGVIKDYINVVDGTYSFTNDGDDAFITIKIELTNKPKVIPPRKSFAEIRLNAVGEIGNVYDTGLWGFSAKDTEFDKVEELLKGNIGDVKTITFKWDYYGVDDNIGKKIFTEATSFELIDQGFDLSGKAESPITTNSYMSNDEDDITETKSSSNSNNWDSVLDEYEKYVNKYIACMKKSANGDISALSDMASLMETAEKFSDKLEAAEDEMTSKQIGRYTRISSKLLEAAGELQ